MATHTDVYPFWECGDSQEINLTWKEVTITCQQSGLNPMLAMHKDIAPNLHIPVPSTVPIKFIHAFKMLYRGRISCLLHFKEVTYLKGDT